MSKAVELPETIEIAVGDSEEPRPYVERTLQQVYGSGTYLSDFYESNNGVVSVSIGNSFPKDVTDCRPGMNRVIKYIAIDDIAELSGKYDGSQYRVELLSREDVNKGFKDAKERLRDELEQAMAKASYKKIATTPAVENQLNPIKQILRWTRLHQPVPFEEVQKAQNKENGKTLRYVNTLEELGFIEFRDGKLFPQDPLEKYELGDVQDEEFNQKILGEVIEQGFKRLSRDLGLGILLHLPKFANGYYLDALERRDPELHLDMETIQENVVDWYGYSSNVHRYELEDKLNLLASLDILDQDEGYFIADRPTYQQMSEFASV